MIRDALVGNRGVHDGVRYRAVAHERLQRPIDSTSRQGVASSMPQHVSMDLADRA